MKPSFPLEFTYLRPGEPLQKWDVRPEKRDACQAAGRSPVETVENRLPVTKNGLKKVSFHSTNQSYKKKAPLKDVVVSAFGAPPHFGPRGPRGTLTALPSRSLPHRKPDSTHPPPTRRRSPSMPGGAHENMRGWSPEEDELLLRLIEVR